MLVGCKIVDTVSEEMKPSKSMNEPLSSPDIESSKTAEFCLSPSADKGPWKSDEISSEFTKKVTQESSSKQSLDSLVKGSNSLTCEEDDN